MLKRLNTEWTIEKVIIPLHINYKMINLKFNLVFYELKLNWYGDKLNKKTVRAKVGSIFSLFLDFKCPVIILIRLTFAFEISKGKNLQL